MVKRHRGEPSAAKSIAAKCNAAGMIVETGAGSSGSGIHDVSDPIMSNASPLDARVSVLAMILIQEVLWGTMSACKACQLAKAAIEDGANRRDLDVMATIGAEGTWAGNCWRDLKRIVFGK